MGAGIAQSVYRRATSLLTAVRVPAGARDCSLLYSVQTGSGTYSVSYPIGTGRYLKQLGREANHSPLCNAMVINGGAMSPLSHTSSWHDA
jgi:hypothetical protein